MPEELDSTWLITADEDRKERRRKLGLPEELTDEEKAAEAKKEEEKAAAKAGPARVAAPAASLSAIATMAASLRKILVEQKKQHPDADAKLKTCWSTLLR